MATAACAPPDPAGTERGGSSSIAYTHRMHQRAPHHKGPLQVHPNHQQREGPVPKAPATLCIPVMGVPLGTQQEGNGPCTNHPALLSLKYLSALLHLAPRGCDRAGSALGPAMPHTDPISPLHTSQHRLPFASCQWLTVLCAALCARWSTLGRSPLGPPPRTSPWSLTPAPPTSGCLLSTASAKPAVSRGSLSSLAPGWPQ